MSNESKTSTMIASIHEHLRQANAQPPGVPRCAVIQGGSQVWSTPSSDVLSTPVLRVSEVFAIQSVSIAASLVSVRYSPTAVEEQLHYHSSHVVGIGARGAGWLRIPGTAQGQFDRLPVSAGDVVVIPKGGLHIFECDPRSEFDYVALELSDTSIDYQQHRYTV